MADGTTLHGFPDAIASGRSGEIGLGVASAPTSSLWRLVSRRETAIAVFNVNGDAVPFYCVHPISEGVTSFNGLARLLPADQPFYGLQMPRQKTHAAFAGSIEAIARYHVQALSAFQPEGPLAIGGWSAGAIVALEIA